MNLNPRTKEYASQVEILHTTKGAFEKVGSLTLEGAKFTASSVVKAGTAVSVQASGLCKPWDDADTGKPYLTNHDVIINADKQNVIVGGWEEALVVESKLTGVTAAFKTAAGSRYRYF